MNIYLDNAATTPIDEEVKEAMWPFLTDLFGNPSSKHRKGREVKRELEQDRGKILSVIEKDLTNTATGGDIVFTSGGTEANNMVLQGFLTPEKNHIITTAIEHDCILKTTEHLKETKQAKVDILAVNEIGLIDQEVLKQKISKQTALVSIIYGNNEIGTLQSLENISQMCRDRGVLLHIDACQSFGKAEVPIELVDIMTINAHKIHGPKGVGAVYLKKNLNIKPLLFGGGQEEGRRSGTENTPGIIGLAKAVEKIDWAEMKRVEKMRDKLEENLLQLAGASLNGPKDNHLRLPNIINLKFTGLNSESLLRVLDTKGIFVSTGSACQANTSKNSHVLKAIGLNKEEINSSLRISLSRMNTEKEITETEKIIKEAVLNLRETL